jgi:hypothetical protein
MSDRVKCPECQHPLPADAPEGLCPECLLKLAMERVDSSVRLPEADGCAEDDAALTRQIQCSECRATVSEHGSCPHRSGYGRSARRVLYVAFGALTGLFGCFTILLVVGTMAYGPDGASLGMLGLFIGPIVGVISGLYAYESSQRRHRTHSDPETRHEHESPSQFWSWRGLGALSGFLIAPILLGKLGVMLNPDNGHVLAMLGLVAGPCVGFFLGKWVSARTEHWIWAVAGALVGAVVGFFGVGWCAHFLSAPKSLMMWLPEAGCMMGGIAGAITGWRSASVR